MKKEISLPDDWGVPIIKGINAMFPDNLKARAVEIVRHPDTPEALRLLAERGYDDMTLYAVLRACAFWSHFPERADGPFSNRKLMRDAQQAARGLYKILRTQIDGKGGSITSTVRCFWLGAPEMDDKSVLVGLLLLDVYFEAFTGPGKKQLDLRVPGLLRELDRLLLHGKRRTIHTGKVYEAIALLRQASFGGRKVTSISIKKEIERFRRRFPEAKGNK